MERQPKRIYEFGPFHLDKSERLLLCNGENLQLTPKAFETLLVLVENSGHVLEKDELMKRIWPDTFVEEATLAQNIFKLRRILGESTDGQQYIETIPRRGYRFIAPVREVEKEDVEAVTPRAVYQPPAQVAEVAPQPIENPDSRAGLIQSLNLKSFVRIIAVTAILFGLSYQAYNMLRDNRPFPTNSTVRTMAVLPFVTLNQNDEDEFLGLGMADALITKLSNVRLIVVRPTSAVLKYRAVNLQPVAAGKELMVNLVLEGRIQRFGDRVRVTVQLVSVEDGAPLWAEKFDKQFDDIFTVQDSISEQVVSALTLRLSSHERELLTKRYTNNTDAYNDYIKGRFYWNKWTEEGFNKGLEFFQKAVEKDPRYALAYVGMADAYSALAFYNYIAAQEAMPLAKRAAQSALEIDNSLPEGRASLAVVLFFYDWDWGGAEKEFKLALEGNPSGYETYQSYGVYLLAMGRFDESVEMLKRAQELNPVSLITNTTVGFPYYFAGQNDKALEQYNRVLDMDKNFGLAYSAIGDVYIQMGMYKEAISEFEKCLALLGRKSGPLSSLGQAYALAGDKARALKVVDELKAMSQRQYISPFTIALVYTGLAEKYPEFKDEAFKWIESSVEERSNRVIFLKFQPSFKSLRSDPRFASILNRVGLAA
jgi:DNA-binding winged helix-turn-helix (wHTH) protein/TolB-like protein/Tfp pilus assembly protein PilF